MQRVGGASGGGGAAATATGPRRRREEQGVEGKEDAAARGARRGPGAAGVQPQDCQGQGEERQDTARVQRQPQRRHLRAAWRGSRGRPVRRHRRQGQIQSGKLTTASCPLSTSHEFPSSCVSLQKPTSAPRPSLSNVANDKGVPQAPNNILSELFDSDSENDISLHSARTPIASYFGNRSLRSSSGRGVSPASAAAAAAAREAEEEEEEEKAQEVAAKVQRYGNYAKTNAVRLMIACSSLPFSASRTRRSSTRR